MSHPFGDLLTQYRSRKHGLTQARLAMLAGYHPPLITRMCQGRNELTSLSGRERVVRLIAVLRKERVLHTLEEANALLNAARMPPLYPGQHAEAALLRQLTPAAHLVPFTPLETASFAPHRTKLPAPLTTFIGRQRQVADLIACMPSTRVLTLTGAGGVGKTRLVLQVAAASTTRYPDGVWYAELAALTDPDLLVDIVTPAVGLSLTSRPTLDLLTAFIRDRQALLVLDNCEHLIDAAAAFTLALQRACPRLTVLATSREVLNVEGETIWRVPPMQLEEAAQLFVERARTVRPDLTFDDMDATVIRICQRLDGMPLAIELAATRLQGMSLSDLAARLDDRFSLLTDGRRGVLPRHQTLRAMIDWSYDLLLKPERVLFHRLAIFVGGWTAELAEQVCTDAGAAAVPLSSGELGIVDVLPLLLQLVRKSLVVVEECEGETRYRYLETLRAYALQKLVEHGELEQQQCRYAQAVAALAEQAHLLLRGPRQREWLARLDREYPNLRAALAWSFAPGGDPLVGCRIFGGLQVFWYCSQHPGDPQRWGRLSRAALTEQMPLRVRGAVWLLSTMMNLDLASDEALAGYRQALAFYAAAGDRSGVANATGHVGLAVLERKPGDAEGRRLMEEGIALARDAGDTFIEHWSLKVLGDDVAAANEWDRAEAIYQETIRLCGETGDLAMLSWVLFHLAGLRMGRLQFHEALSYARRGADAALQVNDYSSFILGECAAAECIRQLGDVRRAVELGEATLAIARDKLLPIDLVVPVHGLAKALNDAGEHARSRALLVGSVKALCEAECLANYRRWGSHSLDVLACVASGRGDAAGAARLLGAADAAFAYVGQCRFPYNEWEYAPYIAKARLALGNEAFEAVRAEGRTMTREQAVAYALQRGDTVEPPIR